MTNENDDQYQQHAVLALPLPLAEVSTTQLRLAAGAAAVSLLPPDAHVDAAEMDFARFRFFYLLFAEPGVRDGALRARLDAAGLGAGELVRRSLVVAYARRVFQVQQKVLAAAKERERWQQERELHARERALREKERESERWHAQMVLDNTQLLVLGYETMFASLKHQTQMCAALPSPPLALASTT